MNSQTIGPAPGLPPPAAQRTVVLVDDDAAVLESVAFAFELEQLSVKVFQSAADAIANVDAENVDCLIVDYHLGVSNGLELLSALRAAGVTAPAIIITSNPPHWLRRHAADRGIAIVEKPLLGNGLLETLRKILKEH